jgi:hypothetical protein
VVYYFLKGLYAVAGHGTTTRRTAGGKFAWVKNPIVASIESQYSSGAPFIANTDVFSEIFLILTKQTQWQRTNTTINCARRWEKTVGSLPMTLMK